MIAAVLESDDHERLYMGLSLLVSAAVGGPRGPRAARLRRADGVLRARTPAPRHRLRARTVRAHVRRAARHRARAVHGLRVRGRGAGHRRGHGTARGRHLHAAVPQGRGGRGADLRMRRACPRGAPPAGRLRGLARPGPVRGQALRRRRQREPHAARLRRRHRHLQRRQTHADPERDAAARPRARTRPVRAGRAAPGAPARPERRAQLPRADAGGNARLRGHIASAARRVRAAHRLHQ